MKAIISTINLFFESLHEKLRQRRYWIFFAMLFATILLSTGIGRITIDESVEAYLRDDDPVKIAYDRFRSWFGSDEYVYVVYQAKDGDIFSSDSLETLHKVHDELVNYRLNLSMNEKSPLDHIMEVKSLINVKYMEASNNTLFSRNFVGDILPKNSKARENLRHKALNHPDYPGIYLSSDSRYGGIVIRTDLNAEADSEGSDNKSPSSDSGSRAVSISGFESKFDPTSKFEVKMESVNGENFDKIDEIEPPMPGKSDIEEYPAFVNALNTILEKPEYSQSLKFYPVGNPIIMHFFATAVMADMSRLMSLVLLLITCMLFLLFRSLSAVLWPVVIIVLTIVWTLGIIGWSGITMSAMVQVIVFLAISTGVADAVHILSGYLFFRNRQMDHDESIRSVMKKSGLACMLTSITTAVGLLSLVLVPLKPVATFGVFASISVLFAFLFTMLLLPLMLDLWSPVSKKKQVSAKHSVSRLIEKIESVGVQRAPLVISLFSIAGVVLLYGALQLKVDSNFVELIKDTLPLRQTYNIVDRYMGGTSNMEIMMEFNKEDALKDPQVLFTVEAVQKYMKEKHGDKITKTISLVNVVKESYKALNDDDPDRYIIPSDPLVLGQVLFLFSNANPNDRRRLVSDDYSRGRIGVNALNVSSTEALAIIDNIQSFMDSKFSSIKSKYPKLKITLTGNMALLAIMLDYMSWSQIKSFSMALVVISIILLVVLGSYKAGVIALIPNLFPILTTFGLMGFLKIPLDADTLIVAPIIMGLAVDDTIHFMTHLRLEMLRLGNDFVNAAVHAMHEAGQAITFTSIILSAGFLVFLLSFHNGLSHFGIFSAIAIMSALVADLFLLPALCKVTNIKFS